MMAPKSTVPREPVLTRAGVVTALAVLSAAVVKLGGPDVSTWVDANSDWIAGGVLAVGPVAAGWLARRHVTPVVDPHDSDGTKLAPAAPVTVNYTINNPPPVPIAPPAA